VRIRGVFSETNDINIANVDGVFDLGSALGGEYSSTLVLEWLDFEQDCFRFIVSKPVVSRHSSRRGEHRIWISVRQMLDACVKHIFIYFRIGDACSHCHAGYFYFFWGNVPHVPLKIILMKSGIVLRRESRTFPDLRPFLTSAVDSLHNIRPRTSSFYLRGRWPCVKTVGRVLYRNPRIYQHSVSSNFFTLASIGALERPDRKFQNDNYVPVQGPGGVTNIQKTQGGKLMSWEFGAWQNDANHQAEVRVHSMNISVETS